jgi:hypothetical protein
MGIIFQCSLFASGIYLSVMRGILIALGQMMVEFVFLTMSSMRIELLRLDISYFIFDFLE